MAWRRQVLGVLGLGGVVAGIYRVVEAGGSLSSMDPVASLLMRVGMLLLALWLALPQIQQVLSKIPTWLLGPIAVGSLIVIVRPRLLLLVVPIVGVIIALQATARVLGIFGAGKPRSQDRRDKPMQR